MKKEMDKNGEVPLELDVRTEWEEMTKVLEETTRFFEAAGLPEDSVNTYAMVVCELVENGIKYGKSHSGSDGAVHISVRVSDGTVTIQVTNKISDSSKTYLEDLDRTIQWVRGYQDPFEAFMERMKAISREPLELARSGLGIVRIAYEGRAALDFFLGEDNTLSVLAVSRIER